jgi:hypothetical protein
MLQSVGAHPDRLMFLLFACIYNSYFLRLSPKPNSGNFPTVGAFAFAQGGANLRNSLKFRLNIFNSLRHERCIAVPGAGNDDHHGVGVQRSGSCALGAEWPLSA